LIDPADVMRLITHIERIAIALEKIEVNMRLKAAKEEMKRN